MLVKLFEQGAKGTVYDKYTKKDWSGIYKILHYCPKCNSDIFGEWEYDNRSVYFSKMNNPQDPYNTDSVTFYPESTYIKEGRFGFPNDLENAKVTDKTKYNEILDITPVIKQYRQEIENFLGMDICPVCGKKLPGGDLNILVVDGVLGSEMRVIESKYRKYSAEFLKEFKDADIGASIRYNGRIGVKVTEDSLKFYNPDDNESILKYFRSNREIGFMSMANDRLERNISKYDIKDVEPDYRVDEIKADVSKLKDFIGKLVQVETNIFSLTERLKKLYYTSVEYELDAFASTKIMQMGTKSEVDNLSEEYEALVKNMVENVVAINDVPMEYPVKPIKPKKDEYPLKPIYPLLKKPNLFNRKSVTAENEIAIKKYNDKCLKYEEYCQEIDEKFEVQIQKYNKEYKIFEQKIADFEAKRKEIYDEKVAVIHEKLQLAIEKSKKYEEESNSITTPEKIKLSMVNEEILKAEELLKGFYVAKNKLYGSNIVFEKYCNFVAISSFYEYLSAGRCAKLEGADGAYNIYENEIRLDTVIGQLTQVIESLEQIQKNQYVIYSAIKETNKHLNALNSSMENAVRSLDEIKCDVAEIKDYTREISENSEITAYYSQVNAYYSKKNAELTNALGYMVALK